RCGKVDALIRDHTTELAKAVTARAATVKSSAGRSGGGLEVKLVSLRCKAECKLQLEISNPTDKDTFWLRPATEPVILFDNGVVRQTIDADQALLQLKPKGKIVADFE